MGAFPVGEDVASEVIDGTLVVTLDRPARSNALTEDMMRELRDLWMSVDADPGIRCIVLTGAGRAFCAGADMAMLSTPRTYIGVTAAEELGFIPGPLVSVPVIVAVNGACAGAGLHFVTDADICIASDVARFVDPHVSVGQVSGMEPLELMLSMRRDRAVRMALLGSKEVLDANAALDAGLVSEVVAADELLPRALELAATIALGSPEALRVTRATYRAFEADLLREHLDRGWQAVQDHWPHPDANEGPTAFVEKRAPRWTP